MYHRLLTADGGGLTVAELYELAGGSTALRDEIRLARARLGLAVQADDDKMILAWLAMVHALVRVQEGIGEGETELRNLLQRIGQEVRAGV
jgi:protein involved in polysaccharide export with SLBB domain